MKVQTILNRHGDRPVEAVAADEPVATAVERLARAKIRSLAVVDGGALVGIVTVRDLLRFLSERGGGGMQAQLREAMTPNPATVQPGDELDRVRSLLATKSINHVPVLDGAKLVGMLTAADVLSTHLDDVRALSDDLQRYIHGQYTIPL